MAKGNLFLGDARGKVGDVVLYVKNGDQVSRVRRRSVRNPNTESQLVQRAILATVGKAYQAGAAIFDHSFEGVRVGADSQAKFQRENLNLIRSLVVSDLDNNRGDGSSTVAVVPRGAVYPVANPFKISSGSLYQNCFEVDQVAEAGLNTVQVHLVEFSPDDTLAQFCQSKGLIDDDIFTIVAFGAVGVAAADTDRYSTVFETRFGFVRLRVKTSALSSSTLMSAANYEDLFEIDSSDDYFAGDYALSYLCPPGDIVTGATTGAIGVIRSRENQRLRSNSQMVIPTCVEWGLISKYLYDFWDPAAASVGQSDLILEGGGFQ